VVAELRADRSWIGEELECQNGALDEARQSLAGAKVIEELYPRLLDRINSATIDDKIFVLDCLDGQINAGPSGEILSLAVPEHIMSAVSNSVRGSGGGSKPLLNGLKAPLVIDYSLGAGHLTRDSWVYLGGGI